MLVLWRVCIYIIYIYSSTTAVYINYQGHSTYKKSACAIAIVNEWDIKTILLYIYKSTDAHRVTHPPKSENDQVISHLVSSTKKRHRKTKHGCCWLALFF